MVKYNTGEYEWATPSDSLTLKYSPIHQNHLMCFSSTALTKYAFL